MKAILLPTDFSQNSLNAIDYAMELFKDETCDFYFLNIQKASSFVSDDLMTMSSSTTIYQTLIDTAKKSIENVIKTLKDYYQNDKHTFHSCVDYDNFIDGVNQMCDAVDIDLIVMGTKGATGAERVLFGSNTVRVMQRCHVPVLAIPDGCKFVGLNSIAFASDYLTYYNEADLEPMINIAMHHNAKIDVVHMLQQEHLSEDQENNRAFLDSIISNVTHEFVTLEQQDIFEVIQKYIEDNNIKMLAMMSKKYSFLERLFSQHNVEVFGFKINVPFLVMENTGQKS
jgi:nucleotide-binding universal stress UspA family protein